MYLPELIRELETLEPQKRGIFAAKAEPGPVVPIHPLIQALPPPIEADE